MTFTFYNCFGKTIARVAITTGAARGLLAIFCVIWTGGNFQMLAVFPVTGDASTIRYVQASSENSAGTSFTGRVRF
jgi:hypothetical protein